MGLIEEERAFYAKNALEGVTVPITIQERMFYTARFFEEVKKVHGDRYDYPGVVLYRSTDRIKVVCKVHGWFYISPRNHIKKGWGCRECNKCFKVVTQKFIDDSNIIHNNKYDYSETSYRTIKKRVIIICKEHGSFEIMPLTHLKGLGCQTCDFIKKYNKIHVNKYDYSKTLYTSAKSEIIVICKLHGEFNIKHEYHVKGRGCKICK